MSIEKKMKKHNIVTNLVAVLDADNPDLLSVVLLFLKKLSIIKENKDEMVLLTCTNRKNTINCYSRQIGTLLECCHALYKHHRSTKATFTLLFVSFSIFPSVPLFNIKWSMLAFYHVLYTIFFSLLYCANHNGCRWATLETLIYGKRPLEFYITYPWKTSTNLFSHTQRLFLLYVSTYIYHFVSN